DQEVAVVVRESVEEDDRVLASPHEQVLAIVASRQAPAEEAAELGVAAIRSVSDILRAPRCPEPIHVLPSARNPNGPTSRRRRRSRGANRDRRPRRACQIGMMIPPCDRLVAYPVHFPGGMRDASPPN